jgi:1,4-alpha-glucan branching enzyme
MTGGTARAVDRQEMAPLGEQRCLSVSRGDARTRCSGDGVPARQECRTFRLWAPNAASVAVIGEVNGWDANADPLVARGRSNGYLGRHRARWLCAGHAYKYRS